MTRWAARTTRGLHVLLVAVFIVVQATALSHELEHVTHQHDAPCGLHVAADHLVLVPAPEPPVPVALAPAANNVSAPLGRLLPSPVRANGARAPPFLS